MTRKRLRTRLQALSLLAAWLVFPAFLDAATIVWNATNNISGNTNWSTSANWVGGTPTSGNDAKFFDNGAVGNAVSNIDNVVDSSVTVGSVQYGNTNGNHTTFVAPGNTLTISGANGLSAGTGADNGGSETVAATITGPGGTVVVNNSSASVNAYQGSGTSGSHRATLDMSGLGTFTATVSSVQIGVEGVTKPTGTIYLARTNTITASGSSGILMGDASGDGTGTGNFLFLGVTNFLRAGTISISRGKGGALSSISFNPGFTNLNASVRIRAANGTSRVGTWEIGNATTASGGNDSVGVCDFSGGSVDALADTMIVGRGQTANNGSRRGEGTLTFAAGTIDANTLNLGQQVGIFTSCGAGTINVLGPATLIVNTLLDMGEGTASNTKAALNIFGGTIRANSITNGASANSVLAMNNGTLIISNAVSLTMPNMRTTNSTMQFPIGNATTNFLVTSLACGGTTNIMNIMAVPAITSFPASLRIIKYSSLSGSLNFGLGSLPAASPPYAGYISNNTASGAVDLVLTAGPTVLQLRWSGAALDGNWNTTSLNWLDIGNVSAAYSEGARARFDDSATGPTSVNLAATFSPNGITVSNSSLTYTFSGSGALAGFTGVAKQGAGTLIIANTGNNNFTGAITNSSGTLQFGNGGSGGSVPPGAIINNATLVFNRSSSFTLSNPISGSGSLTKNGSGTLTLAGNTTYAGDTSLNAGKLVVNSLLSGGGTLTAASGTTLAGAGTNTGTVLVSGALQPGDAGVAGTFASGALTLNSGATVQFDVGGFSFAGAGPNGLNQISDLLQVNGNLTLNNNSLTINLIDPPQIGKTYRIANYTGSRSGNFNSALTITGGSGYSAALDYSTPGQINLTFTNGPVTSIPLTYPEGPGPATVSYGPDGKLVYTYEPNGDRIPDFSTAGYRGGGMPIPTNIPVVITLNPVGGDNRPQIQSAIDTLAAQPAGTNGFRGAILLKKGIYTMTGTINLNANGIVLRGEGSDTNGTILRRTDVNADILNISNGGGSSKISGSDRTIVNNYVPVGATWMTLNDASGYSAGDEVFITRPQTTAWVNYVGMGDATTGGSGDWQSGDAKMSWTRVITEVDGNRIRIDTPLTQAIERQWTTGTIYRQTSSGRLNNCGVEDIRGDAPTVGVDANGNTDGNFFTLGGVRNCWIRRCYNDKMRGHVLKCGGKWCTFEDIVSYHNYAPHSGASIQIFTGDGMDSLLFHRITASSGGFEFSGGRQSPGPVVFSECQVPQGIAFSGPHLQWNLGYLWDELEMTHNIALIDQHGGWTSANHLLWNCESTANYTVERPAGTRIWVQGCQLNGSLAPVSSQSAAWGAKPAEVLSLNTHLEPGSLYRAQLAERIGAQQALTILGKPDGCNHYVLNGSASAATVPPGQSTNFTITMTVEPDYRGSNVTFSAVGLPPGATAGFTPPTLNTNGIVTVTINTSNSTPSGVYNVKLTGTGTFAKFSGGNQTLAHPVFVQLSVTNAAQFTISAVPDSQTVVAGDSAVYGVTVSVVNGYNSNIVFRADGLPPNSSYSFNPPSVTGAGSSTLTVTTSNNTAPGDYPLTISGDSGNGSSGTSADLTVAPAPGTLPLPWVNGELGSPTITGQGTYSNGTFIVNGSGVDIGGASDEGHFVYQPISGDVAITARVFSLENTGSGLAKAGVMIRESTDGDSKFVDLVLTPSNGALMQSRASAGGTAANTAGPSASAPYWLRLQRMGNIFTGFTSPDGTNWTQIAATNIPMSADIVAGLVVSSHNAAQTNTALFDNVSVEFPDFFVTVSPNSRTVDAGLGTSYTVEVGSTNGFSGTVTLSEDDDIIVGGTVSFATNLLTIPGSTLMTLETSPLTPSGTYTLTVTAEGGSGTHNDSATLTVQNSIPPGTWVGASLDDDNWSTIENWSNAQLPAPATDAKLFDYGVANTVSNVNNVVDSDVTINSLDFGNTNGFHTTLISPDTTLIVSGNTGANGNALFIGTAFDNGSNQTVNATITGGGTLLVSNTTASVNFGQGSAIPFAQRATLDMSGLDVFAAALNNFYVGNQPANNTNNPGRQTATIYLARTNSITLAAAGSLLISQATSDGTTTGNILYLGQTNAIFANTVITSGGKGGVGNRIQFNPAVTGGGPVAYVRGAGGGTNRVSLWAVGYATSGSANNDSIGTNDFTGGVLDALVDTMILGRGQGANNAGRGGNGMLTFNSGTLNVNTLEAGFQVSGNSSFGVGAVNVNGSAKLIVNNVLGLGSAGTSPGASTKGTLNINGGTAWINSITNGGSGTSAISMNGGVLVITNSIGTIVAAIPSFSLTNATLHFKVNGNAIGTNAVVTNLVASGVNTIAIDSIQNVTNQTNLPLISYTTLTGSVAANFSLGALPAGFTGSLVDNAAQKRIDLNLSVAPIAPPFIASVALSGGNVVINGTNGPLNRTYYVLASTNISMPLSNWVRIATNTFDASGAFSISNATDASAVQQYYLLQVP